MQRMCHQCVCVSADMKMRQKHVCVSEKSELLSVLSERVEETRKHLQSLEQVKTLTHTHPVLSLDSGFTVCLSPEGAE